MYFGLCNSTATFQAFMNEIFHPVIAKHNCWALQLESTWTTSQLPPKPSCLPPVRSHHSRHCTVTDVLQIALNHDLYFKPEKCIFHAPSIDYLGVILEKGVTHMDPVKISGIKDWPTPTSVKDIRSFLGFCNFYCPFIRGFASIARLTSQRTHPKRRHMDMDGLDNKRPLQPSNNRGNE
jgi:hypothetical protein